MKIEDFEGYQAGVLSERMSILAFLKQHQCKEWTETCCDGHCYAFQTVIGWLEQDTKDGF
jgi:xanthine dehydrogenase iron-sulfur cluster and FAD-binding subunit A